MITQLLQTPKFRFNLRRWQKASIVSFVLFLLGVIISSLQNISLKSFLAILLVAVGILSFFWLEKKERWRKRIAKYSLPFILMIPTGAYFLVFPPSLFSYGVAFFSSIGFYFFASRLKIPLPFNVREEVTYYWLDIVIFWAAFLVFFVSFYFIFYLLNIPFKFRFSLFSIVLLLINFYLTSYSLWARNRNKEEIIFYSLVFDLVLAEFLFIWGFLRMSPIGGGLLFILIFYFFLETLNTFFKYQYIREKDLIRIVILIIVLGLFVMLIFKPFTVATV